MAIYVESPDGPLENQIIGGVPVLADNWGFGIENGRPYFDTGMASPGQQAYLRLIGGRVAIIGQSHFLGVDFVGTPMPPNQPGRALRAGFVGTPMPADPPGWNGRERLLGDSRPLPRNPTGWYERERVPSDPRPPPPMPPNRAIGAEFTGTPLPAMLPNRAADGGLRGTPLPPNAPSRAAAADFTGSPVSPNAPACAVAADFTGRPLAPSPPSRGSNAEFTGAPLPPNPLTFGFGLMAAPASPPDPSDEGPGDDREW